MSWDDFAVQIEDPQPGVFQLGYVNLPTAEIPGVEAELTFMLNDAWQVDATLGYNDAHVSEATTLTLTDEDGVDYVREVEDGARLPLTPDWSGALGIEWRSGGQLVNAQPFARLDYAYVGEVVTNLEGFESVVGQAGVSTQAAYETADFRVGLEGEQWSGSLVRREPRGRARRDVPQQPLGAAAPVDHPAADLRAAVPLRFLTRVDIGVPIRSFGQVQMEALGAAVLAQDQAAWNENVQRQTDYEVHEQTRSIVLLFAKVDDWPAIEVSKQPGWDRLAEVAVPVMHEIIGKFYPPGGTIIRAMAAKLLAGGRIVPHRDSHPSFGAGHRIHVPIVTNPRVRFMIDGRPYQLQVGEAYEINNQKVHSVMNKGAEDRINFIFDYMPPGASQARS